MIPRVGNNADRLRDLFCGASVDLHRIGGYRGETVLCRLKETADRIIFNCETPTNKVFGLQIPG